MLSKYYSAEKTYKIIYEDGGHSKTIRGNIIDEDDFLFIVKGVVSGDIMFVGKRAVVKLSEIKEQGDVFG